VQTSRPRWRPQANSVRGNTLRGSGLADLALSASARGGNCFRTNRASTALPARLQKRPCRAAGGDRRVQRALEAPFQTLLDRAIRAIRPIPYTSVPPPPPQPSLNTPASR
jgi:hypothetical protein